MRVMPIRATTATGGWMQVKASFRKNKTHYLREGLGLAIFMISACFFSALLWSEKSLLAGFNSSGTVRSILMGVSMGATALFIFYSPFTAPSGSHINPAVTITFLRIGKMCRWDTFFYIIFQLAGGLAAVYTMQIVLGEMLVNPPVNSVVTVPGRWGSIPALVVEFAIAFSTMCVVLFTSHHPVFEKYTRIIAACLVCCWVVFAGPVSGFGMNPARTLASAIPSNIWTASWIYMLAPLAGMLAAAEVFLFFQQRHKTHYSNSASVSIKIDL